MRLLVKVGYNTGLLLKTDTPNVGAFIAALDGARVVRDDTYPERKLIPIDEPLYVEFLSESFAGTPDAPDQEMWVKAYQESQKHLHQKQLEVWTLETKLKKLEKGETS